MRRLYSVFIVLCFVLIVFSPFLLRGFVKPEMPGLVVPEGKCVKDTAILGEFVTILQQ